MRYIFSILLLCSVPTITAMEQDSSSPIFSKIGQPISKEDQQRLVRCNVHEFQRQLDAKEKSFLLVAAQQYKQLQDKTYYYAGLKKVEIRGSVAPVPIATVFFRADREKEEIHLDYIRAIGLGKNDELEENDEQEETSDAIVPFDSLGYSLGQKLPKSSIS